MDVPTVVEEALGDEPIIETVPLKGDDALFLTGSQMVYYGAEGFLSDESVETYPHDAERIRVTESRRKAKIILEYGTDGERTLTVSSGDLENALYPVLTEVLRANGAIDQEETVEGSYRFGELTLVVTDRRLIKHVGTAVWDEEDVAVPYETVEGLATEEGKVASQLVLKTSGRTERIKTPNEQFRMVNETVRDALYAYYDVENQTAFERAVRPPEEDEEAPSSEATDVEAEDPFEDDTDDSDDVVFVSAAGIDTESLRQEIEALESAIDEQEAAIEAQQQILAEQRERLATLRDLIEE